jgi:formylglycine-generating enzyme required for sulfatase activity
MSEPGRPPGEEQRQALPATDLHRPGPGDGGVPAELLSASKFTVLGKLGEGGMGSVWKAKHSFLDCLVAIKVMKAGSAGHPEAQDRFLQEMRAAGKLQHPRIVRAYDAERAGDLLLLVLEYVDGVNLHSLVAKKGPLPVDLACRWVVEAAEGLQHAFEKGMVHRDIKPANLMLTADTKEVKILDFGLARLPREPDGSGGRTRYQTFMGTPEYVAPEQATDARSADIRADIYSLGCTLYFLLAGRPPFRARTPLEILAAHRREEARPVSAWRKDVPAELVAVVAKMLAKSPAERYRTPAEVIAALLPFAAGVKKEQEEEPMSLPPEPPAAETPLPSRTRMTTPPAPPARRRPKKGGPWRGLALAALAAVLMLPAVVVWLVLSQMEDRRTDASPGQKQSREPLAEVKPEPLPFKEPPPEQPSTKEPPAKEPPAKEPLLKEPPAEVKPGPWPREVTNSIGMRLVRIPAGKFLMGSPARENQRDAGEGPQHEVEITKPFYLGVYEVTQEQFQKVMGFNPSHFSAGGGGKDKVRGLDTGKLPVENVTWDEAMRFCIQLSQRPEEKRAGRVYGLPHEAEWEYACRAGAASYQAFHFGNALSSRQANFNGDQPYGGAEKGDYRRRTATVGSYPPNAWGLHDMHGNVWEWCADWYDKDFYKRSPRRDPTGPPRGSQHVLRGGGWDGFGSWCRSAYRLSRLPGEKFLSFGFRAGLVAPAE